MHTILVADDDTNIRIFLETALTLDGYRVVLAENGEEALALTKAAAPDLMILDIKMPGMHGLEVIEEVRRESKDLPIVILTAYDGMRDDYTVWLGGVAEYLVKPIDPKRLRAVIERSLGRRRASQEG